MITFSSFLLGPLKCIATFFRWLVESPLARRSLKKFAEKEEGKGKVCIVPLSGVAIS